MAADETVLVTGSSGMIGYPLARALAARGTTVVGLDPAPLPAAIAGVTALQGTVGNADDMQALIARHRIGSVVHAGGISGPMLSRDAPLVITEANVASTMHLAEAARRAGIRRFVYASSAAAYGHTPPSPVPDDAPLRGNSLYGATKGAADLIVKAYREQYGLDAVGLRYSYVYGPGRRTDCAIRSMISDALAGRPTRLASGAGQRRHYTYIDDAVDATVAALDAAPGPQYAYNVAGPDFPSMEQIAELVWSAIRTADIEMGSEPPSDRRERLDITAMERDLGFRPQWTIERGVPAYIEWMRAEMR